MKPLSETQVGQFEEERKKERKKEREKERERERERERENEISLIPHFTLSCCGFGDLTKARGNIEGKWILTSILISYWYASQLP